MKKVIYISWEHLSAKVERDWYISDLISNDVHVEYWDACDLLLKKTSIPALSRDYVVDVKSYEHLEGMLRQNAGQDVRYILLVCFESRFYRFFRLLTRNKCKLYFISWGHFPIHGRKKTAIFKKIISDPRRLVQQLVNRAVTAVAPRIGLVKPIDVMFVAGYATMPMHPPRQTKIVPFNLCDYDNYLFVKDKPRLIEGRYAVFLDINLGYHPDVQTCKLGNYIDSESYRTSLDSFFKMIEIKSGTKVVVAAHPSANYSQGYFNGRTILKGVTPELVKDAEFVISHHSASISYAVLNRKPIVFIYTDEMEKLYPETLVPWIKDIAGFLNASVQNIDLITDENEIAIAAVDEEAYDRFKYGYLTTRETEGRLNRETFCRELLA